MDESHWIQTPMEPEPDKSIGFTFVGNDTWQPKPLYEARKRQRRKATRKGENGVIWTR